MPTANRESNADCGDERRQPLCSRISHQGADRRPLRAPAEVQETARPRTRGRHRGEPLPRFQPHAIEAVGRYYNGRIYPGYPEPEVAEAEQALSLASILVRHAEEGVPVIPR